MLGVGGACFPHFYLVFDLPIIYDEVMCRARLFVCLVLASLLLSITVVGRTQVQAVAISGDFNNDGVVNLNDHQLFVPVLHTTNATYSLIGVDGYVDIYDYNQLLTVLTSVSVTPSPSPTVTPTTSPSPTPSTSVSAVENVKVVKNIIVPLDNDTQTSLNANLEWAASQSGNKYTIYFAEGDSTPEAVLVAGTNQTGFNLPRLKENTTYYWQIETIAPEGKTTKGPVRKFTTEGRNTPADDNAMVVIPDGDFMRGCDSSVDSSNNKCNYNDEWHIDTPLRSLWIDAFKLDKYEVTNKEYKACVTANKCKPPGNRKYYDDPTTQNDPVVFISNFDAQDYCAWEGKRLPTEAEWEKAARGAVDTRLYPWGNDKPTCDLANGSSLGCRPKKPHPIGEHYLGSSPYGARDMAGNVFEWVHDKYTSRYYATAPAINPQGPPNSRYSANQTFDDPHPIFIVRSGAWGLTDTHYLRVSHRHYGHHGLNGPFTDAPLYRSEVVGFRCAQTIL